MSDLEAPIKESHLETHIKILTRVIEDLQISVENYRVTMKLMAEYIAKHGLEPFWYTKSHGHESK